MHVSKKNVFDVVGASDMGVAHVHRVNGGRIGFVPSVEVMGIFRITGGK